MILVFDSSVEGFSIGLFDVKETLLVHQINTDPYTHTELLVPSILNLLNNQGADFQQITKVITTKGPGSFTGIRVGLAVAAGVQAALNVPVITVNTLSALAHSWMSEHSRMPDRLHVILDTQCGEFYYQAYSQQNGDLLPNTDPASVSFDYLEGCLGDETIITYPSSAATFQKRNYDTTYITPLGMIHAAKKISPSSNLQPLYVRPANVTQPNRKTAHSTP